MQAFLDKILKGNKTYIVAVLFLVFNGLYMFGIVDAALVEKANLILTPLGLAFLRAGIGSSKND